MLYIVTWKGSPATRNQAIERFLKTGGAPPAGVKMLGRWHALGRISGVTLAEAADPLPLQQWCLQWSDLFEMDVAPALTDEQAGPLLAGIGKQ